LAKKLYEKFRAEGTPPEHAHNEALRIVEERQLTKNLTKDGLQTRAAKVLAGIDIKNRQEFRDLAMDPKRGYNYLLKLRNCGKKAIEDMCQWAEISFTTVKQLQEPVFKKRKRDTEILNWLSKGHSLYYSGLFGGWMIDKEPVYHPNLRVGIMQAMDAEEKETEA